MDESLSAAIIKSQLRLDGFLEGKEIGYVQETRRLHGRHPGVGVVEELRELRLPRPSARYLTKTVFSSESDDHILFNKKHSLSESI